MQVRSIDSLGAYLREQRRNAELSLRQLAERAGVSNPYLSQVERGLRKPSAEVLSQLAKALSVSAEAMYVRAGLLDPDEDESGDGHGEGAVPRAIRADPHLAERHKRVLLEIYESFRREAAAATGPAGTAGTAGAAREAGAAGPVTEPGREPGTAEVRSTGAATDVADSDHGAAGSAGDGGSTSDTASAGGTGPADGNGPAGGNGATRVDR